MKVSRDNSEGNVNICTKFYGSSLDSCQNISLHYGARSKDWGGGGHLSQEEPPDWNKAVRMIYWPTEWPPEHIETHHTGVVCSGQHQIYKNHNFPIWIGLPWFIPIDGANTWRHDGSSSGVYKQHYKAVLAG